MKLRYLTRKTEGKMSRITACDSWQFLCPSSLCPLIIQKNLATIKHSVYCNCISSQEWEKFARKEPRYNCQTDCKTSLFFPCMYMYFQTIPLYLQTFSHLRSTLTWSMRLLPSLLQITSWNNEVKIIPVTGLGGPWGCETLRVPHYLDNLLTDGKVVSPMRRPHFTPQENSWYLFLLEAELTPGPWEKYY